MSDFIRTPEFNKSVNEMYLGDALRDLINYITMAKTDASASISSSEKLELEGLSRRISTAQSYLGQAQGLIDDPDIKKYASENEPIPDFTDDPIVSTSIKYESIVYPPLVQLGSDLCGLKNSIKFAKKQSIFAIRFSDLLELYSISIALKDMVKLLEVIQEVLNNPQVQEFTSQEIVVPF